MAGCSWSRQAPGNAPYQARVVPQPPTTTEAPAPVARAAASHGTMKPIDLGKVRSGAPAIEAYLTYMVENGASDLHLSAGETPMLRLHGEMVRIAGAKECSTEEAARLL